MKNELIYGNEPFLVAAYKKKAVEGIAMPDINVLYSDSFTDVERDFARQAPFMDAFRVLIIQVEKLQANDLLERYLKDPAPRANLYLFTKEADKRLSLYKSFPKENVRRFDKEPAMLKNWVLQYVKKQGCQITKEAYGELAGRLNYELEEINLYHVQSALRKLCVTEQVITPELVKRLVPENEKEDIFGLIQLIDEKRTIELFHQADLMIQRGEQNIIGTLSLLLRSYRILYKISVGGCTLKEAGVYYRTYVPHLTGLQAGRGMDILQDAVNGIKSGKYLQEFALKFCLSRLCQL